MMLKGFFAAGCQTNDAPVNMSNGIAHKYNPGAYSERSMASRKTVLMRT
jgi:hypothetical protein